MAFQPLQIRFNRRPLRRRQIAHHEAKAIAGDLLGCERLTHLSEIMDNDVLMLHATARAVKNGQMLGRRGVAIFQAAEGDGVRRQLPAAAHDGDGVRRGPASFFKPIKGKRAMCSGTKIRDFLDLEIIRLLLQLHDGWFTKEMCQNKKSGAERQESKTVAQSVLNPTFSRPHQ